MELRKTIIPEPQLGILFRQVPKLMSAIKAMFPNKSGQKEESAWKFPKFHKLLELPYSVYKWGQLLNTSCQTGERAHTALTKKAYLHTNYKNPHKQMIEYYLRRMGVHRRTENLALLLKDQPNHRLAWKDLDPRWRSQRKLRANKAKRVFEQILIQFVFLNFFVLPNFSILYLFTYTILIAHIFYKYKFDTIY